MDEDIPILRSMQVEFFMDDNCQVQLPGPKEGVDVVASGTREAGIAPLSGTGPHLAFDGLVTTTWTAQCGAGSRANEPADCRAGVEWVGLDFNRKFDGLPVMVRCLRLIQSRSLGCCNILGNHIYCNIYIHTPIMVT